MTARWMLPLAMLAATGCTSVRLSKLDGCVVQKTDHWGDVREEILYCEAPAPKWSDDRSVRLAQECLHHDALTRRDQLILANRGGRTGDADLKNGEVFSQCYPEAIRTVQGENDMLKDRAARTDEARMRAENSHAKLEEGLTKALDRPINAVADAKSSSESGSGSDVKHAAEVRHSDVDMTKPREQITRVEVMNSLAPRPKKIAKKVTPPATTQKECINPCAASTTTPATNVTPSTTNATPATME